ncbi:TadE/TadG family type IV pilus assembly protein [Actinobacillus capsulatus]|uniref:TadE/TadG family type IV pilus assembly protein n=1 Tax=Actinobacillus capsulatus TaxID=717 RepID=UPI0003786014|nr:TadE family protein [Actinobacillus capsulatus]
MKNTLSRFIRNVKGVATIEFSLTIGLFILVLFMIAEGCRIALLSSYLDLSVSEASRVTRKNPAGSDYQKLFNDSLKNNGRLWSFLSQDAITEVNVKYANTFDDLVEQRLKDESKGSAFAQYSFQYKYKPLFFWVPKGAVEPLFHRNIVVLQEYEKDKATSK